MKSPLLLASLLLAAGLVTAAEQRTPLKEGVGRDTVEAKCISCHSIDYIVANSTFMTRQAWDAELTKMIKAYGAPVSEADAREIADYLSRYYGTP